MSLYAGHFSRSSYDKCAYPENIADSTAPFTRIMDTTSIYNCNGCLTTFGPRSSLNGVGVSTASGHVAAQAQANVDIDSVLSNRNMPISRCRKGKLNPVNVTKLKSKHMPICNDYLDSQHTKMSDPAMFYRGAAINRFHDLHFDPQENIFWNFATNTRLDAKDNFVPDLPVPLADHGFPDTDNNWKPRSVRINSNPACGKNCTPSVCHDRKHKHHLRK